MLTKIRKRDGRIVDFDKTKITNAIFRAAISVGGSDKATANALSDKVVQELTKKGFNESIPEVEDIQDAVEKVLIEQGHVKTAKAYILHREQHRKLRDIRTMMLNVDDVVGDYLRKSDWRVNENANVSFSFAGLQLHSAGSLLSYYALNEVYPKEIANTHVNGDFHLHDLYMSMCGYCAGWSLKQLLYEGFNGVPGRIDSKPPNHLNTAIGQMINFLGTLQNEWAGAEAFSSFDTYLAPYVRKDNLSYKDVKQTIQVFNYNMNIPSRWGSQTPFTNVTLDWVVPEDMKDQKVVVGGKLLDSTYADYQPEMDMINKAFLEVLIEGDAKGRIFTFPIPTYNITRDFNWNSENVNLLFDMTAKYGLAYFQNFVNSELNPGDVRSMCCRLQLDLNQLRQKTGGLFGSGESTGSLGVVTINMPRIGYLAKDEADFFEHLDRLMYLAKESLEIKRKIVNRNMHNNLLPYTKRYLGTLDNHFSTIGLVGMHEALLNFMGKGIETPEGRTFTIKVLKFMRDKLKEYQNETGHIYNLEATPAEGCGTRFARIDKKKYPNIITANNEEPFYTNSTQLPVWHTDDIFEALDHQDELQKLYSGGTVLHGFLGEKISSGEAAKKLVRKIAHSYQLPYFTLTPTFSICTKCGYIAGEHHKCPTCRKTAAVYSRVVGYFRPVSNWNTGKQKEFEMRKTFSEQKAMMKVGD
jgi:ribonucleoside-triphosphate reductase